MTCDLHAIQTRAGDCSSSNSEDLELNVPVVVDLVETNGDLASEDRACPDPISSRTQPRGDRKPLADFGAGVAP